ncbi:hypothetical protein AAC387_Pa06g1388 [Persea americana]
MHRCDVSAFTGEPNQTRTACAYIPMCIRYILFQASPYSSPPLFPSPFRNRNFNAPTNSHSSEISIRKRKIFFQHPNTPFSSFRVFLFLLAAATTQRWDKALTLMMVMIHKKLELFLRGEFTGHENSGGTIKVDWRCDMRSLLLIISDANYSDFRLNFILIYKSVSL